MNVATERYRSLVISNVQKYKDAGKLKNRKKQTEERENLARTIITTLLELGYRLLEPIGSEWITVTEADAIGRAKQAMSDKASRKKNEEDDKKTRKNDDGDGDNQKDGDDDEKDDDNDNNDDDDDGHDGQGKKEYKNIGDANYGDNGSSQYGRVHKQGVDFKDDHYDDNDSNIDVEFEQATKEGKHIGQNLGGHKDNNNKGRKNQNGEEDDDDDDGTNEDDGGGIKKYIPQHFRTISILDDSYKVQNGNVSDTLISYARQQVILHHLCLHNKCRDISDLQLMKSSRADIIRSNLKNVKREELDVVYSCTVDQDTQHLENVSNGLLFTDNQIYILLRFYHRYLWKTSKMDYNKPKNMVKQIEYGSNDKNQNTTPLEILNTDVVCGGGNMANEATTYYINLIQMNATEVDDAQRKCLASCIVYYLMKVDKWRFMKILNTSQNAKECKWRILNRYDAMKETVHLLQERSERKNMNKDKAIERTERSLEEFDARNESLADDSKKKRERTKRIGNHVHSLVDNFLMGYKRRCHRSSSSTVATSASTLTSASTTSTIDVSNSESTTTDVDSTVQTGIYSRNLLKNPSGQHKGTRYWCQVGSRPWQVEEVPEMLSSQRSMQTCFVSKFEQCSMIQEVSLRDHIRSVDTIVARSFTQTDWNNLPIRVVLGAFYIGQGDSPLFCLEGYIRTDEEADANDIDDNADDDDDINNNLNKATETQQQQLYSAIGTRSNRCIAKVQQRLSTGMRRAPVNVEIWEQVTLQFDFDTIEEARRSTVAFVIHGVDERYRASNYCTKVTDCFVRIVLHDGTTTTSNGINNNYDAPTDSEVLKQILTPFAYDDQDDN